MSSMDRAENEINSVESQLQGLRRERVFLVRSCSRRARPGRRRTTFRRSRTSTSRSRRPTISNHPDLISLRRQIDMMRSGGSPTGMTLRQQVQQQRSILAEARQRYGEEHPDIKRIQRNIESLEARIKSGESADDTLASDSPMAVQLQTQLNATDTQIAALQARGLELRRKMTDLETRMTSAPQVEREFQTVTRDLASARSKFEELLQAADGCRSQRGGHRRRHRRQVPHQVRRRRCRTSRPSRSASRSSRSRFALALIAAMTSIVFAQMLDPTVRGVRDIRDILDVTPLTAVPVIERPGRNPHRKMRWAFSAREQLEQPFMSIIEEAVRKNAERHNRQSSDRSVATARRVCAACRRRRSILRTRSASSRSRWTRRRCTTSSSCRSSRTPERCARTRSCARVCCAAWKRTSGTRSRSPA